MCVSQLFPEAAAPLRAAAGQALEPGSRDSSCEQGWEVGVERGKPCASKRSSTTGRANPWNIIKKGVRDALRVQGEKKEGVRLEQAFIHNFRPFLPPKDCSVQKRRQSLVPLALKALLALEVLPPSQVKQQSLTVPTTTPCLSSAHPCPGKGEIPSLTFPTPNFWWSRRCRIPRAVLQCDTANDQLIRQRGVR